MKRIDTKQVFLATLLALLSLPAHAADAPKPTVEQLELQVKQLQAALVVVRQQRDAAYQQANEMQVQQAVQAVTPAPAK